MADEQEAQRQQSTAIPNDHGDVGLHPGQREGGLAMTTLEIPLRADALLEYREYVDEGCEVSPTCLACPLPVCRYEHPDGIRGVRTSARDAAIRNQWDRGATTAQIARAFAVSGRTVARALARTRE